MTVKKLPKNIGSLKGAPYNPRDISDDALQGLGFSMDRFGDLSGITWNSESGHLVSGHQRIRALVKKYGDELEIKDDVVMTPNGEVFHIRVVAWDEVTEKAALLAANNPHIQGKWTSGLGGLLEDIENVMPDVSDMALLRELRKDLGSVLEEAEGGDDLEVGVGPPEMELQPYEHYDYVLYLFKDERDWRNAVTLAGLEPVNFTSFPGKKKIGLGRVLDGRKLLELFKASK